MATRPEETARQWVPAELTVETVRRCMQECRGCSLYDNATQAVPGGGEIGAHIMLVGEQPGDKEDQAGEPFVGPAGRQLDELLEAADIVRSDVYVTNAVKHFKFEERGKRRLHKKPTYYEIDACRPWLAAEIELVGPQIVVALGSSAARSLLGKSVGVDASRQQLFDSDLGPRVAVTYHPSAALRHPYSSERERIREALVEDLVFVKAALPG